ncbi:MAG: hypothetical protein ACRDHL_08920 [Candidatus Promineifilaceae bacterium]
MTDIRPLRDPTRRFPRPAQPSDVLLVQPAASLSPEQIFRFLTDPHSEPWQHRLDWKHYMRLLAVNGWVFKTSEWHASGELQAVAQKIDSWQAQSRKIKIWHPDKVWFVLRHNGRYWACSATPRLVTLQDSEKAQFRIGKLFQIALRARWVSLGLWILFRFGLLLDFKKENFAIELGAKRIYYIDDELYTFDSVYDFLRRRIRPLS